MDDLTNINITKLSYCDVKCDLLIVGLFENNKYTSQIKKMNKEFEQKLINAIEVDNFKEVFSDTIRF